MDIVHEEGFWVCGVNRQKVADLAEGQFHTTKSNQKPQSSTRAAA